MRIDGDAPLQTDLHGFSRAACFGSSRFHVCITGERDRHATLATDGRFAKETKLRVGLGKDLIQMTELDLSRVSLDQNGAAGTRSVKFDVWDGQTEDGTHVQGEFGEIL